MFDSLSTSEKKALPKMFEQFITSRAFRSTMTYDLNSLPGPSTTPQPRKKLFGDSNSSLKPLSMTLLAKRTPVAAFGFMHMHSRRTSYRFPLLNLPAELRIPVANYVLRVPGGLQWFWKNYRKGPRVATLNGRSIFTRHMYMEDFTSLNRTCKQIYNETRGLIIQLNAVSFDLIQMHSYQIPKACRNESDGSSRELRAASDALEFIQKFAPCEAHRSLKHLQVTVRRFDVIRQHWYQFRNLVDRATNTHVAVIINDWDIIPFGDFDRKRLELLEDEGEPFVAEHEQMRQRVDDYLGKRQEIQDFMVNLDHGSRNWTIHPPPIDPSYVEGLKECLPGDVWDIMEATADHGI